MSGYLAAGETYTSTIQQLFAGDGAIRTDNGTFATAQNLVANTVIARITATNLIVPWAPGASDGSQKAIGITCEAVNTTSPAGAAVHPYYISGDFNEAALTFAGTPTAAQKAAAFDGTPITTRLLG
jgi:hypothetical protein